MDADDKRCVRITHPNIFPGWGCCRCSQYNSDLYAACKACDHERCDPNGPRVGRA